MCRPWSSDATAATFTPDSQRSIARAIPGAQLHVFPVASSQFPFLENPVAFNEVIERFPSS